MRRHRLRAEAAVAEVASRSQASEQPALAQTSESKPEEGGKKERKRHYKEKSGKTEYKRLRVGGDADPKEEAAASKKEKKHRRHERRHESASSQEQV